MSKLLHKQGWKIACGDKTLICIKNGKGGIIDFDIVVTCKFVQSIEVAAASIGKETRLNTNKAYCLLGHQNKDSVHKTARELG